jgi:hypothetical protein
MKLFFRHFVVLEQREEWKKMHNALILKCMKFIRESCNDIIILLMSSL